MKRSRIAKLLVTAVGVAGFGCQSAPQSVPVIPTVTPPAPTPTPINQLGVSPFVAPGPVTIWQKMGLGKQQLEFCRRALCDSPAGALMGHAIAPVSKLTGGIIPPLCPAVPSVGELLDPGAIGANSKVKMDKLNAEKRKQAVEELGNVDCHYWPEAEDALIGALRADRNECVRHTAALVLNRGCCCTPKTIEALTICVSGSDRDGHPCEKSARVRAAAAIALEACLERAGCPTCPIPEGAVPVEEKKQDERPKSEGDKKDEKSNQVSWSKSGPEEELDAEVAARKQAKAYYDKIKKQSMTQILERARRALETMPPLPLDLSVPNGHPDYEAAGVRTSANGDGSARPANVYDMLLGKTQNAGDRFNHNPVIAKSAVMMNVVEAAPVRTVAVRNAVESAPVKATVVTNAIETAPIKTAVKTSAGEIVQPKMIVETAPAKAIVTTSTMDPPLTPKMTFTPTAPPKSKTTDIKPAIARPAPIPVPVPMPAAKIETKVSPLAMPVSPAARPVQAEVVIPKMMPVSPAVRPVQAENSIPKALPVKPATRPAQIETSIPKAMPVSPAAKPVPAEISIPKSMSGMSNANRVLKLLDEPCDVTVLRQAIDTISALDVKDQPKLMPALLKAAEYPSDTGIRVACLKAVARGKVRVAEAKPSLEKISRDADSVVAAEAARTLQELRTGR